MRDFTHLHVHSEYSILDGMSKIKDLVDESIKSKMNSIALTDHGNMFGIKELADYCKKKNSIPADVIKKLEKELEEAKKTQSEKVETVGDNKTRSIEDIEVNLVEAKENFKNFKPFKPIFGCEVYVARQTPSNPEGSRFVVKEKENMSGYHLVLLAKNLQGYYNLCKIVSAGWLDGYYYRPRIDRKILEQYHEGLIVSTACLAGELHKNIEKGNISAAKEAALWYKNLFGDDFYIELQRHETNRQGGAKDVFEKQQKQNTTLIEIAREFNIKLIATNDVHFVKEEHAEAHDLLICLSTGKNYTDTERLRYTKQEWLKSPDEMAAIFADYPEALDNTMEIAKKVEIYSINSDPIMPVFDIPVDFGTEEEYRKKYSLEDLIAEFEVSYESKGTVEKLGGYDKTLRIKLESDYLKKLTYKGLYERYGENPSEDILERINFELGVMRNMGFPGYFLIVQDLIHAAREMGVSVGPGRGSAAGSVVAYCLKITDIDPLKYDLLFERFLNPDRISLPDIDIDFDDEGRGLVLNWVTNKYGKERVAHIITYGTMAAKSSIKDVARVLGKDIAFSNSLSKLIPYRFDNSEDPVTIHNCLEKVPVIKELVEKDKNAKEVFHFAEQLDGTVRQTGVHACGVIIGSDNITNFVPVSTADDKILKKKGEGENKRIVITQYEGNVIENVGLIKMDFLGLTTLSIIKEAIKNIKKNKGIDIDIDKISIDDELTYKVYSEGNTIAIFQFESPGMQKYLKELKPTVFEDLIAMNALYRPGPMQYIPNFIGRKNGKESIAYDLPVMEKRLKDTYGITVYQEQVMLLSRDIAKFTRGESDELRKAMGKKIVTKMAELKVKFLKGAAENGYGNTKLLNKIWADWSEFAKYAFNKSHATCYSWISYQTAYLKAHYPAEFIAANLTNSIKEIEKVSILIEDANKMGIKVLGPDVNESDIYFTVNKDGNIRFGLAALKGSGTSAAEAIIKERELNGEYINIFDFCKRVNLRACNKTTLESLAYAGAFDCFSEMHRAQFFVKDNKEQTFIERLISYGSKMQSGAMKTQISIFDSVPEADEMSNPEIPTCEKWHDSKKLKYEKEVAGFLISGHPLDQYKIVIENLTTVNANTLNDEQNYKNLSFKEICFAGIVVRHENNSTKTNNEYGKITIEDSSDSFTFFLFGEGYAKFKHFFEEDKQLFFRMRLKERYNNNNQGIRYNWEPVDIFFLEDVYDKLCKEIVLTFDNSVIDTNLAHLLMEQINQHKGKHNLIININNDMSDYSAVYSNFKIKIDAESFSKSLTLPVPFNLKLK